jgi:D-glycero-D-manno-heptose 1,7-bisphosphate phosphatase
MQCIGVQYLSQQVFLTRIVNFSMQETKIKRKALFLDRDGIINEDTAYPYLPSHIHFNEAVFQLCRKAMEKGYLLIVITNQAGVAKGKFTEDDVRALHVWMGNELKKRGVEIERFYYCPHHPEGSVPEYRQVCNCRKPKPGMVEQAIRDFNIDITSSLVAGDKESDRIQIDGLRSVIVKSKYATENYDVEDVAKVMQYL